MLVELRKSFANYGPNKRRSYNWVVSHLRITDFYAFLRRNKRPLQWVWNLDKLQSDSKLELSQLIPTALQLTQALQMKKETVDMFICVHKSNKLKYEIGSKNY